MVYRQGIRQIATSHQVPWWEHLLDGTSVGIGILDQGRLVFVNARLARMSGYPREVLLGLHWSRLFVEPGGCPPLNGRRSGIVQEQSTLVSLWRRADGTNITVLYSLSSLNGADQGNTPDIALSVLDVTQAAGNGLAALRADDPSMVHFPDGTAALCLLDHDHRVANVNQAFCELFSCTAGEVIGHGCREIWGNEDCDTVLCPLAQLEDGAEQACRAMDQQRCILQIMPYRTAHGHLVGTVVTFFDNRRLETMAAALVVARQQLVRAERLSTIGTMVGTMVHECNNALSGVRAVIERMSRKTGWTQAEQKMLRMSVDSCDRMHRLIREMQQCAQPFADDCHPLDFRNVLDAALALLRQYLQGRRVVVGKMDGGQPMSIQGRADQLRQALRSLIRHQGKQFGRSGGRLQVQLWREDREIHLELAAIGVSPLAPLSSDRSEDPAAGKGADGLGLFVADTIIKAHGGRLMVVRPNDGELLCTVVLPECSDGRAQGEEHGTGLDSAC